MAAGRRLRQLGAPGSSIAKQIEGVEIHGPSARAAAGLLSDHGLGAEVKVGDFFDLEARPVFDVVVGNPPYIRYQQFNGDARRKGLRAAFLQSVRLTGLASSWAAFTVHASQFVKPQGRLALVLPAELMSVNYASAVRRFLLERFDRVRIILFEDLIFPGALEEVVLLLAEGTGPARGIETRHADGLADLRPTRSARWVHYGAEGGGKWTPALLTAAGLETYRKLTQGGGFSCLLDWGESYLGAVTGNNDYFTLTRRDSERLALRESELLRISPPGSRHLQSFTFTSSAWEALAKADRPCYLFRPDRRSLSRSAGEYIRRGESLGVPSAYKCRVRDPWWMVPTVAVPDLLLTYMDEERPRLVTNDAGVHILNSVYGVAFHPSHRVLGRELLPLASLNSVTLLGAEVVGRAYGGGLLKLEPREADVLPVPSPDMLAAAAPALRRLRTQVGEEFTLKEVASAVRLVDRALLSDHLGVSEGWIRSLRRDRTALLARRLARGRKHRGAS